MSVLITLLSHLERNALRKKGFNMITLAGGTGLVGKTLTQALVRDGEQVRVLTRDPKAARAAFGDAKLEIVGVDFDDTATLRTGFTGSDKAFVSYGTSDRQVRDEIALIDAAIGAEVPYLVNLSVGGAGAPTPPTSCSGTPKSTPTWPPPVSPRRLCVPRRSPTPC